MDGEGRPFLRIRDTDGDPPAGTEWYGRMPRWSVSDEVVATRARSSNGRADHSTLHGSRGS